MGDNRFARVVRTPAAPAPTAATAAVVRRKYTILLDPEDLRAIDQDVLRLQEQTGERVDRSQVIRVLLRQLHTDESLYAEVLRAVRDGGPL